MPQPSSRTSDDGESTPWVKRGLVGDASHSANSGVIFQTTWQGARLSADAVRLWVVARGRENRGKGGVISSI